tara:strand:- start:12305 stop:13669 length:1365 start_codon:yes stop_codon:yes gene_type:complete
MQGINISNIMSEGMSEAGLKYQVFFFASQMPSDLQSLPFNPLDIVDISQHVHSWAIGLNDFQTQSLPGESTVSVSLSNTIESIPETGEGLTQENFSKVPYKNFYTTEILNNDMPVFTSAISTWAQVEYDYGFKNSIADSAFLRVGREDSSVVLDFSGTKQLFNSRLYYYVPTMSEQSLLDTVFEHHLSTLDSGTYQSTYSFEQETASADELGNVVSVLDYAVDLVAGGTEIVSIYVLKNDDIYNNGYWVDAGTIEDFTSFKKHDIPETEVPIILSAISLRQRLIDSRQKQAHWSGNSLYSTSCETFRVDVWNTESNTWDIGNTYSISGEGFISKEIDPVMVESFVRIVCIDGLMKQTVIYSGDPHWSINHMSAYSKAEPIYTSESLETIQWAMIIPTEDFETQQDRILTASRGFTPYILCDVGTTETDSIEVDNLSLITGQTPGLVKFNLVFKD